MHYIDSERGLNENHLQITYRVFNDGRHLQLGPFTNDSF